MLATKMSQVFRLPNIHCAIEKQESMLNGEDPTVLPPINRERPPTEYIYSPYSSKSTGKRKNENCKSATFSPTNVQHKIRSTLIKDTANLHRQDLMNKYSIAKTTAQMNIYTPDEYPEYFTEQSKYLGNDSIIKCSPDEISSYIESNFEKACLAASNSPPFMPFSYKKIFYELLDVPIKYDEYETKSSTFKKNMRPKSIQCLSCNEYMPLLNCITTNCRHAFCYDCIETQIARVWLKMITDKRTDTSILCLECYAPITHISGYNERRLTKMSNDIYVAK